MRLRKTVKPLAGAGIFLLLAVSAGLQGRPPEEREPPCGAAKIDINSATRRELETLPGIGSARAAMIVRIREANGPFRSVGELRALPRLTNKQFEKLRCRVEAVRPPAAEGAKRGERSERGGE